MAKTENAKQMSAKLDKVLRDFFCKNTLLKLASLFFAMLLWGYVLMEQNPDRDKVLDNVSISFEGESDLISRKLVVRGDRQDLLSSISAKVSTKLVNYADLNASSVNATVNLRSISKAGTYSLPIVATSRTGSVQSVTPGNITVEIDQLVTKRIPIEYRVVGTLQDGYWAGDPSLSRSEIDIEGALSDISSIVKGICYIDIAQRTSTYNEAIPVVLLNAAGEEVSSSLLLGQLPSVSVRQEVLTTKELPVNARDALLGLEDMDENYELRDVNVIPATILVAGPQARLSTLTELELSEMIDIFGRTSSLLISAGIEVPEGIRLLGENSVMVRVDIREKMDEVVLDELPIKVRGAARNVTVTLAAESANLTVRGKMSLLKGLNQSAIVAYVDVTDLLPGTYDLPVLADYDRSDTLSELECDFLVDKVTVTIK